MGFSGLTLEADYGEPSSQVAKQLYDPLIGEAMQYHCMAPSLASAAYHFSSCSRIGELARRGGRIRLLLTARLIKDPDVSTLAQMPGRISQAIAHNLAEEVDALDASARSASHHSLRVLATLVTKGVLTIRVAVQARENGVLREKLGILEDPEGNSVSIAGPMDQGWDCSQLDGGYEGVSVNCSWSDSKTDQVRLARHRKRFEELWEGRDPSVSVRDLPDTVKSRLWAYAAHSVEALNGSDDLQGAGATRPEPRPHQAAALAAWAANGYNGILKHATGSGKTITALFAIEPHLKSGGVVLIFVPSQVLLEQWHSEIRRFGLNADLMLVGAGNTEWRDSGVLRAFTSPDWQLGGRIVLTTMQTARTDDFLMRIRQGRHLFLVADEVHQLGSVENSRVLSLNASKKLGFKNLALSATPERYGDTDGTQRLLEYFGGVLQPEYTLADAIRDGTLVPYEYDPRVVSLTEDEAEEWRKQSREIAAAVGRERGGAFAAMAESSDLVKRLLIRRSRIAKKASGKLRACAEILKLYRPGQRWLVYCEDMEQLDAVMKQARGLGPGVMAYHSQMSRDERATTLQCFEEMGGILVAIACLDEGVNVPSTSHAVILASSQNPRQFIQRRGRILRLFPGKRLAVIFDVLVSPESVDDDSLAQRSLLRSELRRALVFASTAANVSAATTLRLLAVKCGLDPESFADVGAEIGDGTNGGNDEE